MNISKKGRIYEQKIRGWRMDQWSGGQDNGKQPNWIAKSIIKN